jgi:hypothetical protein
MFQPKLKKIDRRCNYNDLKNILNHNILIMITRNILNDCNMSIAITFNVLKLYKGYTVITTIATK